MLRSGLTPPEAPSVYMPDTVGQGTDPALTPATTAQAELRRMVLESVVSAHTRRNYAKVLDACSRRVPGAPFMLVL